MKTAAIGLGAIALLAVAGCGRVATNVPDGPPLALVKVTASPARPPVPPPAITEPFSRQPSVSKLTSVANFPSMSVTLDPVSSTLTPPISAADAYARCQACPHDEPVQGFRQELAYFSANTPATMPAACVPQGVPMPSSCTDPSATVPIYQRRLAWVFTWYSPCLVYGPPGGPPSTPFTCLNVVPFDATSGDDTYTFSGGA